MKLTGTRLCCYGTVAIKKALGRCQQLDLSQWALLGFSEETGSWKYSNFMFISSFQFLVSLNAENLPWGNHLITQIRPGKQPVWPTHSTCFTGVQLWGRCEVPESRGLAENEKRENTLCTGNIDSAHLSRKKDPWRDTSWPDGDWLSVFSHQGICVLPQRQAAPFLYISLETSGKRRLLRSHQLNLYHIFSSGINSTFD